MRLLLPLLLITGISSSMAFSQSSTSADADEIIKILQEQAKAFAIADLATWQQYWVKEKNLVMISDRTIFRGFTEFRQAIEEFHKNVTIADPTVSDFNVHVAGDVAWATFTDYWIAKFKDGKPYGTNNGTVTAGLIKKNGKWLILRFHETPM